VTRPADWLTVSEPEWPWPRSPSDGGARVRRRDHARWIDTLPRDTPGETRPTAVLDTCPEGTDDPADRPGHAHPPNGDTRHDSAPDGRLLYPPRLTLVAAPAQARTGYEGPAVS